MARDTGLFKQQVDLGDRVVLSDVMRVGMMMLFFHTPDGEFVGRAIRTRRRGKCLNGMLLTLRKNWKSTGSWPCAMHSSRKFNPGSLSCLSQRNWPKLKGDNHDPIALVTLV